MTVAETGRVIEYIQTFYPGAWRETDQNHVVLGWADLIPDLDFHSVMVAVKTYVASDKDNRAPNPGQIRAIVVQQRVNEQVTAQDAWNHIRRAISNSGYHAAEEFEKLSPVEQRLAGSPRQLYDWGQMDVETLDSVVASNIMRSYKVLAEREQKKNMLPPTLNAQIEALANKTFRRLTDGKTE